jgi:sugar phosphate permease
VPSGEEQQGQATSSGAPSEVVPGIALRAVLTVFLPFAGGYFLSYLFRSVNAVIAGRLVEELELAASALGLLTSAYFLAFACFQLPLGLLLDRFGPRRVQATLLLSAALGAAIFGLGQSLATLILGRALIGLGVAGGLMASFKAITLWFPKERWPLVNGCFMAMGGLGAISATTPVELALQVTDWRGVFFVLAGATVLVSLVIFLFVPEKPVEGEPVRLGVQMQGFKQVYRDSLFWSVAPVCIVTQAAGMAIQGLWAGPWLVQVAGLTVETKADYLLYLAVGMTLGFVTTGLITDLLGRLGIGLKHIITAGTVGFLFIQVVLVFRLDVQGLWPWLLWGIVGYVSILVYPLLSRHFPLAYAGRVNTAINLPVFLFAFGIQYAIGGMLDLWQPDQAGHYPPAAYSTAFGIVLLLEVATFLWFLLSWWRTRRA